VDGWRVVALLVLAALAGGVIWKNLPARTASVEGPNPIAELISAEVGGITRGGSTARTAAAGPRGRSTWRVI